MVVEVAVAGSTAPRHTARGIVLKGDSILLMERWRQGLHYFSIPGGGIETGEAPEQTVKREIMEETAIEVNVGPRLIVMQDGPIKHEIYVCEYISGEPHLPATAPEAEHHDDDNRFLPGWHPLSDIANLPLAYWEPVRQPLMAIIEARHNDGYPELVIVRRGDNL